VGVPPRVALCLTKGAGLSSLASVAQVEVRFVRLPRSAKSRVRFQPRGEGFHAGGMAAVRMDLEHVLLESLRGHTALSEGDWLPIRHNGVTYELVVRELEPEKRLVLLDTDLTVEVLPSEQTEAEIQAEQERKAREEAAAREAEEKEKARILRCQQKALSLAPEPASGPEAVQMLVRLPEGGRLQRRFARSAPLQQVLDWVESEQQTRVSAGAFCIVQKWPGHCRELGADEAARTLSDLGFARQEAVFLQRLAEETATESAQVVEDEQMDVKRAPSGLVEYWKVPAAAPGGASAAPAPLDGNAWSAAEERAHENLDRRIEGQVTPTSAAQQEPELENLKGEELVSIFEMLKAMGMSPPEAATASKKYAAQLKELGEMGFDDWVEAVKLLDKYQGRLLRVANLLAEQMASRGTPKANSTEPMETESAEPTQPAPAAAVPASAVPAAPRPTAAELDKDKVKAKFAELVKSGVDPNEAATKAIQIVRAEAVAAAAAAAAPPAAPEPARPGGAEDLSGVGVAAYDEKLAELASMGFADQERNVALLRKYAGRMERVVEALCSG